MGWLASWGASSCQPELLSFAFGSICACTERTVTNTCVKDPLGGMQLGGSLIDTITGPAPAVGIGVPPPLQPIPADSKKMKAHPRTARRFGIERAFLTLPPDSESQPKPRSTRAAI